MQSFTNLRNARQQKRHKSYVTAPRASSPKYSSRTEDARTSSDLDGLYRPLPSSMEIRTSLTSGRGIWAKEMFKAGSILLSLKPHISVLSNEYLDSHCSSCFSAAPVNGLQRCTQCHVIRYCDTACQRKDWALHKYECLSLQEWARTVLRGAAIPNDAIRCQGRILWKRQKEGPGSVWSKEMDNMLSSRETLASSVPEFYVPLAHTTVRYLGLSSPADLKEFGLFSPSDLVDFESRFHMNTFTLTSPCLTPIGISVSPLVALINHSCDPNAVVVFPRARGNIEPLMQVVALRDIGPNEEILTSYIDTTTSRAFRRQSLLEGYNFYCHCNLCTAESDPRDSISCPKSCGGTCPMPTKDRCSTQCRKCEASWSNAGQIVDVLSRGQDALDTAISCQFTDRARATRLIAEAVPALFSAGLMPSSYPLLGLMRLRHSILISSLAENVTQKLLDEAIQALTMSLAGLSEVLCCGHPVRGVALAELGKLLAVDEPSPVIGPQIGPVPSGPSRLKMGYETLLKARKELLIGFGVANEGGQVGWEVREMLASLEKELGVWNQGTRNVLEDQQNIRAKRGT